MSEHNTTHHSSAHTPPNTSQTHPRPSTHYFAQHSLTQFIFGTSKSQNLRITEMGRNSTCRCSRCGTYSHRPVYFHDATRQFRRAPCQNCNSSRIGYRTINPSATKTAASKTAGPKKAGKSKGEPKSRKQVLLQEAHDRTFNPDGTLKLIPLGKNKKSKKTKAPTYQGSCKPKSYTPKPPGKDGGGDDGSHGNFNYSAMPPLFGAR